MHYAMAPDQTGQRGGRARQYVVLGPTGLLALGAPQSGAKVVLEQFSPWVLYPYSVNSTTALLPTSQFQGGLGRHSAMQRILSGIRLFCIFLSVCLIHTANLYLFLAKDWSCYLFFNCKLYAWDKRKKDRRTHSQRREEFNPAKPYAPCGCLTLLDF